MRGAVELPDVHHVILVLQHGRLIVVHIKVVGGAKDGHHAGESRRPGLPVHAIPGILSFVRADDGEQVVLLEEGACGGVREEIGAASDAVVNKIFACLFLPELLKRVGPEDVTHQAVGRRLPKAINLRKVSVGPPVRQTISYRLDILEGVQFWTQAPVDTEELLVHDRRQRQRTEGFYTSLVDLLAVFVLAFELEGEIICEMPALVVPSQKPQRVRVPNLQGPEVQNALRQLDQRDSRLGVTDLNAKITSVDVVAQKQVPCIDRVAADLEQLHQVVILPMDIAAYRNRRVHLQQVRLGFQNLGSGL